MLSMQAAANGPKIRRKLIQITFLETTLFHQRWNNNAVAVETWFLYRNKECRLLDEKLLVAQIALLPGYGHRGRAFGSSYQIGASTAALAERYRLAGTGCRSDASIAPFVSIASRPWTREIPRLLDEQLSKTAVGTTGNGAASRCQMRWLTECQAL
ncbi:MAG: hypothetical protein V2I51_12250 [Anderseniella sp.]|jgi:hypothetical protein|nr:hypothetical protein [Anderseniella sp.]